MAQSKVPSQVLCPHCAAGNLQGSPYCSSCGGPLNSIVERRTPTVSGAVTQVPRIVADPIALLTSEGQDRESVRQTYDRAASILTAGENIEYIAVAKGGIGHSSDCAVATNKRLLVYRKKVLGKFELDDCYWRDVESLTLSDVKGAANLLVHAIQGWNLVVENLPRPQAVRLQEVAVASSERLRSAAKPDIQTAVSSIIFSAPASEPAVPAPSRPLASPPSTPLIKPLTMHDVPPDGTSPTPQLADRQPPPTGPRSPSTGPTAAPNGAYYIATPESVLQNILQNSALDGDVEAGVPTRPMQWSAAAFQAPALAEVQPVVLTEQDLSSESGSDDDAQSSTNTDGTEAAEILSNSRAGLHAGTQPWILNNRNIGLQAPAENGHDTEPQLRITPPLTTLERIAVFSLPSGALGLNNANRPGADFDPNSLPAVDSGLHLVPSLHSSTTQATGSMGDSPDRAPGDMPIQRDDASDETLRVLAEKISGHLDDGLSFSSSNLGSLHWSMDNTGLIPDDITDAQITENISVLLSPDDISGPLQTPALGGSTVPDPPLVEENVLDTLNSTAEAELPTTLTATGESERSAVTGGYGLPAVAGTSLSNSPVAAPVAPVFPYGQPEIDETAFDASASETAHPTAPMGSPDAYLPVPGSMTSLASGPLLAASSNMEHDLEDIYNNTGPMATQRLEGDLQFDQTDRPTSINLTVSSIASQDDLGHHRGSSAGQPFQDPRASGDDQKKQRVGSAGNRTAGQKAPVDDPIAKMKQLKALLDAGFITDEDYATKKAEILSRI